jgi:hypothetical protein
MKKTKRKKNIKWILIYIGSFQIGQWIGFLVCYFLF